MFTFTTEDKEQLTEIHIGGELSIYGAESFFTSHVKSFSPNQDVHLNLSQVEEIDTAGIQILLMLRKHCEKVGVHFGITSMAGCVESYLKLFNLETHFISPD